jgi:hypothetical protein
MGVMMREVEDGVRNSNWQKRRTKRRDVEEKEVEETGTASLSFF